MNQQLNQQQGASTSRIKLGDMMNKSSSASSDGNTPPGNNGKS